MLEIVWRNPNRLVRTKMAVDKTWRHDSATGQAQAIYRTRAAPGSPDVEYELVVNRREPGRVALRDGRRSFGHQTGAILNSTPTVG
jgi:hypothetical protein